MGADSVAHEQPPQSGLIFPFSVSINKEKSLFFSCNPVCCFLHLLKRGFQFFHLYRDALSVFVQLHYQQWIRGTRRLGAGAGAHVVTGVGYRLCCYCVPYLQTFQSPLNIIRNPKQEPAPIQGDAGSCLGFSFLINYLITQQNPVLLRHRAGLWCTAFSRPPGRGSAF